MLLNLNVRLFKVFVLISLLAGCEDRNSNIEALEDYRQRIHNILDLSDELQSGQAETLLEWSLQKMKYPSKRALTIETREIKINWGDFFNLSQCQELQQIVAQRNNQLGKNMEAATKLLYEISLLARFSQCQQLSPDLTEEQLKAFKAKQKEFPLYIWNNTWAGNYWQMLFSYQRKHQATSKDQITLLLSAISSLRQQIQLSQNSSVKKIDSNDWYKAFQIIESSLGTIGSLSFEMQNHIDLLNQINIELDESKDNVCKGNRRSKEFDYLWNVLNKFYLTEIQKRQAELISMTSDLTVEFSEWQVYFPNNTDFAEWSQLTFEPDSSRNLNERLKEQIKRHVYIWQELQSQCK